MSTIAIEAGSCRYDAIVGPLEVARPNLADLAGGRTLVVVTDRNVWELHGRRLASVAKVDPVFVPQGEAAKSWSVLEQLLSQLADRGLDRSAPVIGFGGGSVGDLVGLAAGLFKRGCPVVHVPTTFLAQVDSAIGGKTAIDFADQKNLVGLFHQPALVIADPASLDTLDGRQMRAGYAELAKYGLIGDPALFEWCEHNGAALLTGDAASRAQAVEAAIRSKAHYVMQDPEDRIGIRALLNFGHTFAHAIESATGFGPVLHGEAVSVGMALATRLSVELGSCPEQDCARTIAHLRSIGIPTKLEDVGLAKSGETLASVMLKDKKADGRGAATLILTRGIGQAFVRRGVAAETLVRFLNSSP